ncbi:MAG: T9SS type A sorting domain-containing protein [Bacteroidales bacterium]|jgi:hypothetical protein|nr:T9SS type A sorting domain-containing protein [Bacteroidales bacterium]
MTFDKRLSIFIILFLFTFTPCLLQGQEEGQEALTGLRQNAVLHKLKKENSALKNTRSAKAIKLPFFEDFSNYVGYPNPNLWMDRKGFVNNTFTIYPPSIGVVTLDALDENGDVYAHASSNTFSADTLTSQPIRLDSNFTFHRPMTIADSIYFSFFYQPGGGTLDEPWESVGNEPETNDKLVLEFGFATGNIIFAGYTYTDYILTGTYYVGDSIPNIYIQGTWYVFETVGFTGQTIQMPSDSLFADEMEWEQVWSTNGISLDTLLEENSLQFFRQEIILIDDEKYLRNNFQFRFRNYASLEGDLITGWNSNVDQWHIDYIRLDIGKSRGEYQHPNDVTFVMPTTSFLKKYQAMPWNQFRQSDMQENFTNYLANISAVDQNANYTYWISKDGSLYAPQYTSSNENASPFYTSGFVTYDKHATPVITFTLTYDGEDSATFEVTHVFQIERAVSDIRNQNDTMVYQQKFHNYYAYDDGTPEYGYTVISNVTNPNIYFAMRFDLTEPDTLRSVRMFFNGVHNNDNNAAFTLKVWEATIAANGDTIPGNELYSQSVLYPEYGEDFLDFVDYFLEEPIRVSGMIFVGYYQNHNVQLNLGFDQNTDARGGVLRKFSSNGEWKPSMLKGSPMVRIVLGKYFDPTQIIDHQNITNNIKIYPNPTNSTAIIEISDPSVQVDQIMIYDMYGKLLDTQQATSTEIRVDLNRFAPGLYLFRLQNDRQLIHTAKVIKQ